MSKLLSQGDIEKISMTILKDSRALDVFPTPVDLIILYAELVFQGKIDLSRIKDPSFFAKIPTFATKIWNKIRGYIDRSERVIYIDLSQLPSRQNFVKLHEVGHHVLPWQGKIMNCLDNDETLDPETLEEFEAEANYFSSITLFQQDRFDDELSNLGLGIKSGMVLGKKFGGSTHAALRRMVERSKKRCALLVLEKISGIGIGTLQCKNRNLFHSEKFITFFGKLNLPIEFDIQWSFATDFLCGRKYKEDGDIELETKNGKTKFCYHYFNNSYNAFVLLFPEGELTKSRTKIILSGYH